MIPKYKAQIRHLKPAEPTVDYEKLKENWLGQKRSLGTRRVYRYNLHYFLKQNEISLGQFLTLTKTKAFEIVSIYRSTLIEKGITATTLNIRLATLKSLVNYAYHCGYCSFLLDTIKYEPSNKYRDTSGVSLESYRLMLEIPDKEKISGLRDFAILLLLWSNALRRNEVSKCNINDFDPENNQLRILGKGRTDLEWIDISRNTTLAISEYLSKRGSVSPTDPLFIAHHQPFTGHRISDSLIYAMVRETAKKAGIKKPMSPHRVRHSAITAALEATNGDVRSVQKMSRHSSLDTLMVYDDNRQKAQGKISRLLADLL